MFGTPKISAPPAPPPAAPLAPPTMQDPTASPGFIRAADGTLVKKQTGLSSLRIERTAGSLGIPSSK